MATSAADLKHLILNGTVTTNNLSSSVIHSLVASEDKTLKFTGSSIDMTEDVCAEKIMVLDRAAGMTITLPASSGKGAKYIFVVKTTVTSNNIIIKVANTSDSFVGRANASTDNATTTNNCWNIASGDDTVTLNGTTKGGYAGDHIEIVDLGGNLFFVQAHLKQTSVEATPFSATV